MSYIDMSRSYVKGEIECSESFSQEEKNKMLDQISKNPHLVAHVSVHDNKGKCLGETSEFSKYMGESVHPMEVFMKMRAIEKKRINKEKNKKKSWNIKTNQTH